MFVWILTGVVVAIVALKLTASARKRGMYAAARRANEKGQFQKRDWDTMLPVIAGMPLRMVVSEVNKHAVYMNNFKASTSRFVNLALVADDSLEDREVYRLVGLLFSDPSNLSFSSGSTREDGVVQAGILYGLLCTQQKGAAIKQRLMLGNNSQGSSMYAQQKEDKEYFEYMNNNFVNFCQLVSILEPKHSVQLETVAGYLISDE